MERARHPPSTLMGRGKAPRARFCLPLRFTHGRRRVSSSPPFQASSTLLAPSVSDAFPVHECAAIISRWSAQRRPARHPCRPCLVHTPLTNLVSFRHEQAGKADISKWSFDLNVGRDTLAGEAAPDPPGFSKQSHEGQVSSELVDPHFRRWWF